ncbi:hypothetical protein U1701_07040 [Sphingomonas sp. PB2P19]|uniref:hypothetical protein n=1 Tax=Sphingomonas rhamnosi TaxID=3096156 RepID=UPI002FC9F9F3
MDARLVWDTWRRILTDDAVVARVLDRDGATIDPDWAGWSAAERAILADYAATPVATETNIGMYREGLVRNALAALSLVPMSQQLLYASGLDVDAVAADYAKADGYADHGPHFWRAAAGFVAHLAARAEFAAPAHQDVLSLDAATIALARRLGKRADAWPDRPPRKTRRIGDPTTRFVASRAATIVRSAHDLTDWIVNPTDFDPTDALKVSAHCWLVYFPAAEADRACAELSERAARVFALLERSRTVAELSVALGAVPLADVIGILDSLAALGVVTQLPASTRIAPAATVADHVFG